MKAILTSLATSGGRSTIYDIASDIGKSRLQIQGALSRWYQNVTGPMGVKDDEGNDSWPWEWGAEGSSNLAVYCMPESVATIVRRLANG